MVRPPSLPDKPFRVLMPISAALLVIIVGALIFTLVAPKAGSSAQGGSGPMSLDYTTEQGQGATIGTVNSPLRITLRVPYNGIEDSAVNTATVQLLDADGQPADFGSKPGGALLLLPTYELGVWAYSGSMPSKPGKYHAHVELSFRANAGAAPTPQAQDFSDKLLQSQAESGPPLTSGFIFTQDSNLWILSTDTKRQRRLTYFPTESEYADNAAWSPDGKTIVFAHTPKGDPSQLPATDIWTINADGTGLRELLPHSDNESLYEPSYSEDSKYIYFTAEKLDMGSTNYDANGQPVGARGIDRYEVSSGKRTHWKDDSHMPAMSGPNGAIVYLGTPPASSSGSGTTAGSRMVREVPNSTSPMVLADDKAYIAFYGPTTSPDGSRVVFAGIETTPTIPKPGGFDLFHWLTFQPEVAYAHGLPWELYSVPTDGKKQSERLTNMAEDQPHAAWLDNSTIAFMGVSGLYKMQLDRDGKPIGKPQKIHDGAPHGGLSWHAP